LKGRKGKEDEVEGGYRKAKGRGRVKGGQRANELERGKEEGRKAEKPPICSNFNQFWGSYTLTVAPMG